MNYLNLEQLKSMIGKEVKAIGCCGIYDEHIVFGVLERFEFGGAIINLSNGQPCLVNKYTLELKNGSCENCNNTLSDSEAFNQTCFECGKKV
jgi:hypothetical protein